MIDERTTQLRDLGRELRWNQAYYRLAGASDVPCAELRARVVEANRALVERGARRRSRSATPARSTAPQGVLAIKPSGVAVRRAAARATCSCRPRDRRASSTGDQRPSSDTPTHLALVRAFAGGRRDRPHALAVRDRVGAGAPRHPVPRDDARRSLPRRRARDARSHRRGDRGRLRGADRRRDPRDVRASADSTRCAVPAALVASHGPFDWGRRSRRRSRTRSRSRPSPRSRYRALSSPEHREPIAEALLDRSTSSASTAPAPTTGSRRDRTRSASTSAPSPRARCSSTAPTAASSGTSVHAYENGVIDERLPAPDDDVELEPDWALQDPRDYVRSLQAAVPALLAETGVSPGGRDRHRHRLHLVHDAARRSPTGRRSACSTISAASRTPG